MRHPPYEDTLFPGTKTKSIDKNGLEQNIENQQEQGNLAMNKG
jgi:hypothetical protein